MTKEEAKQYGLNCRHMGAKMKLLAFDAPTVQFDTNELAKFYNQVADAIEILVDECEHLENLDSHTEIHDDGKTRIEEKTDMQTGKTTVTKSPSDFSELMKKRREQWSKVDSIHIERREVCPAREFWIRDCPDKPDRIFKEKPYDDPYTIHVIEYSAYEKLRDSDTVRIASNLEEISRLHSTINIIERDFHERGEIIINLREALKKYGGHTESCRGECDCGFNEVLSRFGHDN